MKAYKNSFSVDLIQHFLPLHDFLSEMSAIADEIYTEGGMSWDFKYFHGAAHTARLGNEYVSRNTDFDTPPDLKIHTHDLAELIWEASGRPSDNPALNLTQLEYEAMKKGAISKYYSKASEIIEIFKTSGCDKYFMLFDKSPASIWFGSVALSGRNALIHSAFWSID